MHMLFIYIYTNVHMYINIYIYMHVHQRRNLFIYGHAFLQRCGRSIPIGLRSSLEFRANIFGSALLWRSGLACRMSWPRPW